MCDVGQWDGLWMSVRVLSVNELCTARPATHHCVLLGKNAVRPS